MRLEPLYEVLNAQEPFPVERQPIILDFDVLPDHLVLLFDVKQCYELGKLTGAAEVVVDNAGILLPVQFKPLLDHIQSNW